MDSKKLVAKGLYLLQELGFLTVNPPNEETGSPGTLAAWCAGLRGLTPEQIHAGFAWLAQNWTGEYGRKVTPGELRKVVNESANKGFAEAWAEIQRDGHEHLYPYFSNSQQRPVKPEWSSPEIQAAVDQMGGLQACLAVTEAQMPTVRAQFREVWAGIQKRKQTQASSLPQPQRPQLAAADRQALPPGRGGDYAAFEARRQAAEAHNREMKRQASVHGLMMARKALEQAEANRKAAVQARIAESAAVRQRFEDQKRAIRDTARARGFDIGRDENYTGGETA